MTPEELNAIRIRNGYPPLNYTPEGVTPKLSNNRSTIKVNIPETYQEPLKRPYSAPKVLTSNPVEPTGTFTGGKPPLAQPTYNGIPQTQTSTFNPEVTPKAGYGRPNQVAKPQSLATRAGRWYGKNVSSTTKGGGLAKAGTGILSEVVGRGMTPSIPGEETTGYTNAASAIGVAGQFLPGLGRILMAAPAVAGYAAKKGYEYGLGETANPEGAALAAQHQATINARAKNPLAPKIEAPAIPTTEEQIATLLPNAGTAADKEFAKQAALSMMQKPLLEQGAIDQARIKQDEETQAIRDREQVDRVRQIRAKNALDEYSWMMDNAAVERDPTRQKVMMMKADALLKEELGMAKNEGEIAVQKGSVVNDPRMREADIAQKTAATKSLLERLPLEKQKSEAEIKKINNDIENSLSKKELVRLQNDELRYKEYGKMLEGINKQFTPGTPEHDSAVAQAEAFRDNLERYIVSQKAAVKGGLLKKGEEAKTEYGYRKRVSEDQMSALKKAGFTDEEMKALGL